MNAATIPCRSATLLARPLLPASQLFPVSTSSHHRYADGVLATRTCVAAATNQSMSWAARSQPYCQAHACESNPLHTPYVSAFRFPGASLPPLGSLLSFG